MEEDSLGIIPGATSVIIIRNPLDTQKIELYACIPVAVGQGKAINVRRFKSSYWIEGNLDSKGL